MTDIERRLRDALQAKAAEAVPDPATWDRVDRRLRLQRLYVWIGAAAGVAAAAVIALVVLVPGLISNRIELDPSPLATQPAPGPTEQSLDIRYPAPGGAAGGIVFTDGSSLNIGPLDTDADGAQSAGGVASPSEGIARVAAEPSSTSTSATVAVIASDDCSFSIDRISADTGDAISEPVAAMACASSAAFSPEGGYVAWTDGGQAGDLSVAVYADGELSTDVADHPGESTGLDGYDSHTITDWVWTDDGPGGPVGYVLVAATTDVRREVFALPVERTLEGLAVGVATPLGSVDGWWTLAADQGYALQVQYEYPEGDAAGGTISAMRLARLDSSATVDVPAELLAAAATDPSLPWLSALGTTIVVGDGGSRAWLTSYEDDAFGLFEERSEPILHADLVRGSGRVPGEGTSEPPAPPPTTTVQVFFNITSDSENDCAVTEPLPREVAGPGVLRGALEELVKGPNAQERAQGYLSLFNDQTAGALNDVTITDGVARVDLDGGLRTTISDASTSCGSEALLSALDNTVLQFDTVNEVVYSFDGNVSAFYDFVQRPAPSIGAGDSELPAAVAATRAEIRDAAAESNVGRLRELITIGEDFTCFPGPSGDDCVAFWEEQTEQGGDPFGLLVELLDGPAAKQTTADRWVWNGGESNANAEGGPTGPQVGIDADGTWRFFVQPEG